MRDRREVSLLFGSGAGARMGRRLARCFAAAFLSLAFLSAAAGEAWAGGFSKRTPSTVKDEFVLVGEIIFVGSAGYWNTTYDPFNDPPLNLVDSYLPGAATAQEYLKAVNLQVDARSFLKAKVASTSTVEGVTTHDVSSLTVKFGDLEFTGFGTNVAMESATADPSPFPRTTVTSVCSGIDPCDWIWLQATTPGSVSPGATPLTMDSSLVGGDQRGVNLYAGADSGTLPDVVGRVVTTSPTGAGESIYMIDLVVPDLPTAWTNAYGSNVRVVSHLTYGIYYYGVYVPATSPLGGGILILAVLAVGLLFLVLPRRALFS